MGTVTQILAQLDVAGALVRCLMGQAKSRGKNKKQIQSTGMRAGAEVFHLRCQTKRSGVKGQKPESSPV